jgi:small subunit ribosomal protein S4e
MAKGIKKHLKRLKAPKKWALNKMGGIWAPCPKSGPHKKTNSFPLVLILRNKLKYALNTKEVTQILMDKNVKVDGKVRIEKNFPTGIMDIVTIEKTGENFRILYDKIGKFILHRIDKQESLFKICKVMKLIRGSRGIPFLVTHDGRTIRFPDPIIKTNDTVLYDLKENKIIDFIKFDIGSLCIITGGSNIGKIGLVINREKHYGRDETVKIRDGSHNEFSTKLDNVFVIGKGKKAFISLPKIKIL